LASPGGTQTSSEDVLPPWISWVMSHMAIAEADRVTIQPFCQKATGRFM
jgi:hypothetical protein